MMAGGTIILKWAKWIWKRRSAKDCIYYSDEYNSMRYLECKRWFMHMDFRDCNKEKCKAYEGQD